MGVTITTGVGVPNYPEGSRIGYFPDVSPQKAARMLMKLARQYKAGGEARTARGKTVHSKGKAKGKPSVPRGTTAKVVSGKGGKK